MKNKILYKNKFVSPAIFVFLISIALTAHSEIYYGSIRCETQGGYLSTKLLPKPKSVQNLSQNDSRRLVVHDNKKNAIGLLLPWDAVHATSKNTHQVVKNELTPDEFTVKYQDKSLAKNTIVVRCKKD